MSRHQMRYLFGEICIFHCIVSSYGLLFIRNVELRRLAHGRFLHGQRMPPAGCEDTEY